MANTQPSMMTVPGGAVVPIVDRPRRDGPADATAVIVVVEPPPPAAGRAAARAGDPLDTDAYIGQARAQALRPVLRRPDVQIGGERYSLPWDDSPALEDFVRTLYLVHGWHGVHGVRDQLQRMVDVKLHPAERVPADLDPATRDLLAQASVQETQRWAWAYQDASRALATAVLELAARLEGEATTIVQAMLADSKARVVDEMIADFRWKDRAAAVGALRGLPTAALTPGPGLDDLRTRMTRLRKPAAMLSQARRRLHDEVERQRRLLGRDQIGILSQALVDRLAALTQTATDCQAAFSAALLAEAPPRPVLFRFDLETLATDPSETSLGLIVWARLRRTWEATELFAQRFAKERPAQKADRRALYDGAVPEALIAKGSKKSVWGFPKIMRAARAQMPPEQELLLDRLLDELETETARQSSAQLGSEVLTGLGLAALTLALLAVCPPAGIALDVALSAPDVFSSVQEYEEARQEVLSDLDPRASLSDAEPSFVPVLLSVAATLLSAA
jgi:hypothetical protein